MRGLFLAALALCAAADDYHYEEFSAAFALLDHDRDGAVQAWEAALGYAPRAAARGMFEAHRDALLAGAGAASARLPGGSLPDPAHFVSRLSLKYRAVLGEGGGAAAEARPVSLRREFAEYIGGGCTNRAPALWASCRGVGDCGAVADGFCDFSCRRCGAAAAAPSRRLDDPQTEPAVDPAQAGPAQSATVLVTSDWHIDPWYQVDGQGMGGDRVSRYRNMTLENAFRCFDAAGGAVPCTLAGGIDVPRPFVQSHLRAFEGLVGEGAGPRLLFYLGDTEVHDYDEPYLNGVDPVAATRLVTDAALDDMLEHFGADEVVVCVGNNDAQHNVAFVGGAGADPRSDAYAESVIAHGIVTDDLGFWYSFAGDELLRQTDFFKETGYYVKRLAHFRDPEIYAIVTNTNLGTDNVDQAAAIEADVGRIRAAGGLFFFFGHHPWATPAQVPHHARDLLRGSLSGHIHEAGSTTRDLFTQIGAISQAATDTAFWVAEVSSETGYALRVDRAADLYTYRGPAGEVALREAWEPPPGAAPAAGTGLTAADIGGIVIGSVCGAGVVVAAALLAVRARSRYTALEKVHLPDADGGL